MRETPLSNLDKQFILEALKEGKRLDGRLLGNRRELRLRFGRHFGTAHVSLGDTQVMAQVSGSLCEPAASRPSEGILRVFVDFSPMAAPRFEAGAGRSALTNLEEELVEVNRVLERCLKESRCLDMESLCVISEEKVWCIRLDLKVLNHDGNAIDACSVAGLAALCHYKRADVSLKGNQIIVHSASERDPVPLAVHHHPVCSTFAFFNIETGVTGKGEKRSERVVCVDPTWQEEAIMDGKIVIGMNPYREICTLHLAGNMLIEKSVIVKYAAAAADHAKPIVDLIKNTLASDAEARKLETDANSGTSQSDYITKVGLASAYREEGILSSTAETKELAINKALVGLSIAGEPEKATKPKTPDEIEVITVDEGTVTIEPMPLNTADGSVEEHAKDIEVVQLDDSEEDSEVEILPGDPNMK